MKKKHIITLSGKPGSGKSSTSDKVAEMLGYTRYSSGDFVRNIVKKKRITLAQFNQMAASNHALDEEIDEELRKLRDQKDIVIDSRLGFYWIPESFKVYLDLDMDVATVRIYKDAISNEGRSDGAGLAGSIADVQKQVQSRLNNEKRRFKSMYGVDPYKNTNFDLVINTARHSPQTVALTVFDNYKKWLKSEEWRPIHSEVPMGYSFDNSY
ncbi:MAG: cytidylate kinase [Patiriisocius sp.]|jgi:cytidylate kinase